MYISTCSQVRARTSVGYGENSTAFNITLSVEGQPGKKMTANTYLILLFIYFFVKFNLLRRTISYTTTCYCCTSGCSSWMCNCFDCGGSIDLAKMQEQEEVDCVSSQMNEVHPY